MVSVPRPARDLPRQLAGKYSLYQLCRELGVPCPAAACPIAAARPGVRRRVGFPLVAKLAMPWRAAARNGPSAQHLDRATPGRTGRDLASLPEAGPGLMLQEYIPAARVRTGSSTATATPPSRCRPGFTGVKERSYPAHAGLTSLGRWVPNPRCTTRPPTC